MKRSSRAGASANDTVALEVAAGLHQAGRLEEAEAAYRTLIRGSPSVRRLALPFLALLLRQQARPREALEVYNRLAAMGEGSAELFAARGDLLHALARPAEALQSYDRTLAIEPGRPETLNNRAAVLIALGRPQVALSSLDAALLMRPDYAEALYNRGVAQGDLGWSEAAKASYDRALALQPEHGRALNNRALIAAEGGRLEAALADYDRALCIDAADAEVWANRSACLRRLGRLEAALESADRALDLAGETPERLNARGLALAALHRLAAALADYDRALALRPAYPEALSNSGVALVALGRAEEALTRYEAALALDPGFAEAEYNSGLALLRLGRVEAGWRRHEARWRRRGQPGPTFPDATLWLGEEPIVGDTVLIHAEQGLGDTLQFCRYAPEISALGARVILQVQPPLVGLLGSLTGIDAVTAVGEPTPPFDRHVPMMSLPLALATAGVPGRPVTPYLHADPDRAVAWAVRLSEGGPKRVGVVWAGNPAHENDRWRSIPLETLTPLFASGPSFFSLQIPVRAADADWIAHHTSMHQIDDHLSDFAETAAALTGLDLVITVDTSVAHLAGALGRPVWILIPTPSDWRWNLSSGDEARSYEPTFWYPSARVYRQRRIGDWDEVVERVAKDLTAAGLT